MLTKFKCMIDNYYSINPIGELIDISDEKDRNFWAVRLGVSIERLKSAIRATHSLDYQELKKYLRNKQIQKNFNN